MQHSEPIPAATGPALRTSAALVTSLVALVVGLTLGIAASGDNVLPGDLDVTLAVQDVNGAVPDALERFASTIGSTLWAVAVIGVVILGSILRRAWPVTIFLLTLLVLRLAGTQLKPIFDSPRPTDDVVLVTGTYDGTGYPSGHALTGTTLALGLAVLAWRYIPSRPLAIAVIALLLTLGLLIGWARIYSGAHWPSDVVGGFAFGFATVAIGVLALNRLVDMRS